MVSTINSSYPNGMRYGSVTATAMSSVQPFPYWANRGMTYSSPATWNASQPLLDPNQSRFSVSPVSVLAPSTAMVASQPSPALEKSKKKSPIDRKQDRKVLRKLTLITTGISFVGSSLIAASWALIEGQMDRLLLVPMLTSIGALMGVLTGLVYNHTD